ncbi:MAG: sigma-70 family RNA polymerase sigma factor [Clostridia bacterium]|nr:sigma-70 family RNA polymerase sigma factor [Clostridia bacterium]
MGNTCCPSKDDTSCYRELVENNIGLVGYVVNSFSPRNKQEDEEFYSQGCLGLVKAARTFKPESGVQFASYAVICIKNEIRLFLRTRKRYEKRFCYLENELPGQQDEKSEERFSYMDCIADDYSLEEEVERQCEIQYLRRMLEKLPKLEQAILKRKFGFLGEPQTEIEISKDLGISQGWVSRLKTRAIKNLREEFYKIELI